LTALAGADDTDTNGEGNPDETWTNARISAWAAGRGIALGSATRKADMLTVIQGGAE
jgi:hypothetical protein